jgi:hypothetical protein
MDICDHDVATGWLVFGMEYQAITYHLRDAGIHNAQFIQNSAGNRREPTPQQHEHPYAKSSASVEPEYGTMDVALLGTTPESQTVAFVYGLMTCIW